MYKMYIFNKKLLNIPIRKNKKNLIVLFDYHNFFIKNILYLYLDQLDTNNSQN